MHFFFPLTWVYFIMLHTFALCAVAAGIILFPWNFFLLSVCECAPFNTSGFSGSISTYF